MSYFNHINRIKMIFCTEEFFDMRLMIGLPINLDGEPRLPMIYEHNFKSLNHWKKRLFLLNIEHLDDQIFLVTSNVQKRQETACSDEDFATINAYDCLARFLKEFKGLLEGFDARSAKPIIIAHYAQEIAQSLNRITLEIDYLPARYMNSDQPLDESIANPILLKPQYRHVAPESFAAILMKTNAQSVCI